MNHLTKDKIQKLIDSNPVMVFMKGTKLMPQCGFSNNVVQILNSAKLKQRRQGLRLNVQEAEMAEAANKGGFKGMLAYLLKNEITEVIFDSPLIEEAINEGLSDEIPIE